jgi:S1-C subfamily serine protease
MHTDLKPGEAEATRWPAHRRLAPRPGCAPRAGVVSLLLAVTALLPGRADILPADVLRAKGATVLVETHGGTGSAFCIDASGYFVTNQHVVGAEGSEDVRLVLHSGESNQTIVRARVVHSDSGRDLALLKTETPVALTPLELGTSADLIETTTVAAFGYPFGKGLAVKPTSYPAISVNLGHVTSLRKDRGQLAQIQIDAIVNPGNSGGPVLDSSGRVIGIVVSGIRGAGINFAIPVELLKSYLPPIEIELSPRRIPANQQHKKQTFTVLATTFDHTQAGIDLTLEFGEPKSPHSVSWTSVSGHPFSMQVVPNPAAADMPASIPYRVFARVRGKLIGKSNGNLALGDAAAPSIAAISPASSTIVPTAFEAGLRRVLAAAEHGFEGLPPSDGKSEARRAAILLPGSSEAVLEDLDPIRVVTNLYRFSDRGESDSTRTSVFEILKGVLATGWMLEERGGQTVFSKHVEPARGSRLSDISVVLSRPTDASGDVFWLKISATSR